MASPKTCFVIMPFRAELNYFFLYLRKHIEEEYNIKCLRGDNDVLTIPLLDKIKKYIEAADVVIADCSGRNPNVFYELGIAHTLDKKVILISGDEVSEAPADIRHYEFISYRLQDHEAFLEKLDNALTNIFVEDYRPFYQKAMEILNQFNKDSHSHILPIKIEMFMEGMVNAEHKNLLPDFTDDLKSKQFLLPLIMDGFSDFDTWEQATKWLMSH